MEGKKEIMRELWKNKIADNRDRNERHCPENKNKQIPLRKQILFCVTQDGRKYRGKHFDVS
jgi:hypothetical protein